MPRKPKKYPSRNLDLALDAVQRHGMSQSQAARTYGVPPGTLHSRLQRQAAQSKSRQSSEQETDESEPTRPARTSWRKDDPESRERDLKSALEAIQRRNMSIRGAAREHGVPFIILRELYQKSRSTALESGEPPHKPKKRSRQPPALDEESDTSEPADTEVPANMNYADDPQRFIKLALEAIDKRGISIAKAAKEFGIPKITLRERNHDGQARPLQRKQLRSSSRKEDHQALVIDDGTDDEDYEDSDDSGESLVEDAARKRYNNDPERFIKLALDAMQQQDLTLKSASQRYGVPPTTLDRRWRIVREIGQPHKGVRRAARNESSHASDADSDLSELAQFEERAFALTDDEDDVESHEGFQERNPDVLRNKTQPEHTRANPIVADSRIKTGADVWNAVKGLGLDITEPQITEFFRQLATAPDDQTGTIAALRQTKASLEAEIDALRPTKKRKIRADVE